MEGNVVQWGYGRADPKQSKMIESQMNRARWKGDPHRVISGEQVYPWVA